MSVYELIHAVGDHKMRGRMIVHAVGKTLDVDDDDDGIEALM